jgi:hypothetical protein
VKAFEKIRFWPMYAMANMGHPSREEGFVLAPTSALPTYYDLRKQQSSRAPEFPTVSLPMITFGGDFRSLKKSALKEPKALKSPLLVFRRFFENGTLQFHVTALPGTTATVFVPGTHWFKTALQANRICPRVSH